MVLISLTPSEKMIKEHISLKINDYCILNLALIYFTTAPGYNYISFLVVV